MRIRDKHPGSATLVIDRKDARILTSSLAGPPLVSSKLCVKTTRKLSCLKNIIFVQITFLHVTCFLTLMTLSMHYSIFTPVIYRAPYIIHITPVFRIGSGFNQVDGSGSGSRRSKITKKNKEISCFEVLDILFSGLKASPVAKTSFMEAKE